MDAFLHFFCNACGKRLRVRQELAGKHVRCPCGEKVFVAMHSPPSAQGKQLSQMPEDLQGAMVVNLAQHQEPGSSPGDESQAQSAAINQTSNPSAAEVPRASTRSKLSHFRDIVYANAITFGSGGMLIGFFLGGGGKILLQGFQTVGKGGELTETSTAFNMVMLGYIITGAVLGIVVGVLKAAAQAASGTLGYFQESDIPALLRLSNSPDRAERLKALDGLGKLALKGLQSSEHRRQVVQTLAEALRDEGPAARAFLIQCLAQPSLYEKDPEARRALCPALPMLLGSEPGDDIHTMSRTCQAFGIACPQTTVPAGWTARAYPKNACETPVLRGAPSQADVIPQLIAALRHEDSIRRLRATMALACFGPDASSAVAPLIETLNDKSENVAIGAAVALATIGQAAQCAVPAPSKLQEIKDSWSSSRKILRAEAAVAVSKIRSSMQGGKEGSLQA
jgi:hypothetical protein